jgi:hypothetical protein
VLAGVAVFVGVAVLVAVSVGGTGVFVGVWLSCGAAVNTSMCRIFLQSP